MVMQKRSGPETPDEPVSSRRLARLAYLQDQSRRQTLTRVLMGRFRHRSEDRAGDPLPQCPVWVPATTAAAARASTSPTREVSERGEAAEDSAFCPNTSGILFCSETAEILNPTTRTCSHLYVGVIHLCYVSKRPSYHKLRRTRIRATPSSAKTCSRAR